MSEFQARIARGGVLILTSMLLLCGLGVTIRDVRAARQAVKILTEAKFAQEREEASLRRLEHGLRANDEVDPGHTHGDAWSRAGAGSEIRSRLSDAARARARREDGKVFLRTYPEASAAIGKTWRQQLGRSYTPFYRAAGSTPAQIEAFESRMVQLGLDTLEITPTSVLPGETELNPTELRSILGEDGFRLWQEFRRAGDAQQWVMTVALHTTTESQPLAMDQHAELIRIVSLASPEFRAGGSVERRTVDWGTVMAQAREVFTDAQWQQAEPLLLREQMIQVGGAGGDASDP